MLSQTAQYAVRTVIRLAEAGPDRRTVGQLADELRVPQNYLAKTLYLLARAGVVESTRGKRGGFRLGRPAHRITLRDVVGPFEEVGRRTCLLGMPTCTDRRPCPVHGRWKTISDATAAFFARTTVAELLRLTSARSTS